MNEAQPLTDITKRYLEAEQHLRTFSDAAQQLTREAETTALLNGSAQEAITALKQAADSNARTAEQLADVAKLIAGLDPAALQRNIQSLSDQSTRQHQDLTAGIDRVVAAHDALTAPVGQLVTAISRLRILVVVVLVLAAAASALAGSSLLVG